MLEYTGTFLLGVLGLCAHFIKKSMKQEYKDITFKEYMFNNWRWSALSAIGFIMGYAGLIASGTLNVVSAFTVGYLSDSVLNKYDQDSI